ncbi:hypothetical protein UlMin_031155 [Ulmus minor]
MEKERREIKERIVVVLEGIKASKEKPGVVPLSKAMHEFVRPEDEVLVLTLLCWNAPPPPPPPSPPSSSHGSCFRLGDHMSKSSKACEEHLDTRLLHREIAQRKEAYAKLFKPLYLNCETNGIKFEVKIAAGFRPKDIVIEEANKAKATCIVMDRCFAKDLCFQLNGTNSKVVSVNDEGEATFHNHLLANSNTPVGSKEKSNPKSLKPPKEPTSMGKALLVCCSLPPLSPIVHTSESKDESGSSSALFNPVQEIPIVKFMAELQIQGSSSTNSRENLEGNTFSGKSWEVDSVLGLPLKLSREEIEEITHGFSKKIISSDENQHCVVYDGFFPFYKSRVLVKMFRGVSSDILEAEKRAAFSLRHRNILKLIGYHHSQSTTFLVFPFLERGRLDLNLSDHLNQDLMALVKSDIRSFGVLLLRLFCRRSVPQDDETLIRWARPLLLRRAFHVLLDEESEDLDMHEMFRVMCTSYQCTMTKPDDRPNINEVISYLNGDSFCVMQSSPPTPPSDSPPFDMYEI